MLQTPHRVLLNIYKSQSRKQFITLKNVEHGLIIADLLLEVRTAVS
jgi:hypothetical protein